jgi:ribosomal protein S3AE
MNDFINTKLVTVETVMTMEGPNLHVILSHYIRDMVAHKAQERVAELVQAEVQHHLEHDEGLRIVVREMVKQAMSEMNLLEIVRAAVKTVIKEEMGNDGQTNIPTDRS